MASLLIGNTIKTAWDKIDGVKSTFWAAIIVSQLILLGCFILTKIVGNVSHPLGTIMQMLTFLVFSLMQAGIYYMGIQRSANLPIHYKQIFYAFNLSLILRIIGLGILDILIMLIPGIIAFTASFLIIYPGIFFRIISIVLIIAAIISAIYLAFSIMFGLGNLLIKNMGPVDALKKSFADTKSHIFELFIIYILFTIIYILLSLPLGIGLIWGIPFAFVLYGEIYQRLSN